MTDSKDKGLHSFYGSVGVGGYYNYNSAYGYGHPSAGIGGGYPVHAGGYPPVAYPYPPPSGYPHPPQQAACHGHHHHHSGHGGLGAFLGAVTDYMITRRHGHTHGGHHGKYKYGKFGKHGGFRKWK